MDRVKVPDDIREAELIRLEEIATVYDLQASPAIEATAVPSSQPQTDYETLLSALEAQDIHCTLTLNQAYCDGERLYFSYTLETGDMLWYCGEEMPTGMGDRGEFIAGKNIPYSGVALYLRPVYTISGPHPGEDILLIQNTP